MKMKNALVVPIALALITVSFMSCKTRSLNVQVLVPAQINMPQDISSVGLLNHSLPSKEDKWSNILEGFFTGESIGADKEGSYATLRGCGNKLNNSPRFKYSVLEAENYRGTGTKEFPLPLDWTEVENLCKKYNVDVIAALETFDSDVLYTSGSGMKNITKDGKTVSVVEFWSDLKIRVNAGWRIYDYKNKKIIDQDVFTDEQGWHATGPNEASSRGNLPSKRNCINDAGRFAGEMFAVRISPNWVWVPRYYYVKGNDEFKNAKQYVKLNDWKGAAKIWSKYTTSLDPKIAGRACHNMALASEMDGNLQVALEWATKAYKNYRINSDLSYVNQLTTRIMQQDKLNDQMGK
jgi:hypothetical protein